MYLTNDINKFCDEYEQYQKGVLVLNKGHRNIMQK